MTWEETIIMIRSKPEYRDLVIQAYFDSDLEKNRIRFAQSTEYEETLAIIRRYQPNAKKLLDVGSGNGISAVNFALEGYNVTAIEPDSSDSIGAGAIKELAKQHTLQNNITIEESFAEDMSFQENTFDVVYIRQAMHHANDLKVFLRNTIRVLKPGGLLLTVRDHVVFSPEDKDWFLEMHPLHKFYGGENAFRPEEYRRAIYNGGGRILKELKYYDSPINYFPNTKGEIERKRQEENNKQSRLLKKRIGPLNAIPFLFSLYKKFKGIDISMGLDEKKIPGRMYSYIVTKA